MEKFFTPDNIRDNEQLAGRKILFANFPGDGHFNPLTGLAVYLKQCGADVRWYSSRTYAGKLQQYDISHYPFQKAVEINNSNFDEVFPERTEKKSQIAKLKFDIIHAFILRGPEYYADLQEIYREFPFELLVADCAFTGIPFVKELMKIPVVSIGVLPLTETSKDLPPVGLGLQPSYNFFGRINQALLRGVSNYIIFREPNKVMYELLAKYNIPHQGQSLFDMLISKSDYLLQIGTPSFEYRRSDMSRHVKFIGALLPYNNFKGVRNHWFDKRLNEFERVFLVTQGTVEKDIEKLLVPALEAFKDTTSLVVCTTGGTGTMELRRRFPQENLIIEDFIPFADVMPYTDVYISNGGYGGVMLGIENDLPMVVAGINEGKNEINARIGYFKLGINLKTERPSPEQISKAVYKVISDPSYKRTVEKLSAEFRQYNSDALCAGYISDLLPMNKEKAVAQLD